jgi:hypothetical protein
VKINVSTFVIIQNPENHAEDSNISAPKWIGFIHFVCKGMPCNCEGTEQLCTFNTNINWLRKLWIHRL